MRKHRHSLSRRDVLKGIGAGSCLAALGCSIDGSDRSGDEQQGDALGTCSRAPTTWAKARERISSVVVLCMENRSFDHYFGALSLPEDMGGRGLKQVDGLRGNESNPSMFGGQVAVHRLDDFTPHDLGHGWDQMHASFNDSAMDGFVKSTEHTAMIDAERLQGTLPPSERLPIDELARVMASEAMGYHTPAQIPMFYQLAEQAALCESWFCSALAATWTNRFYLHGASAEGLRTNVELGSSLELGDLLSNWQSILDVMQKSNGLKATNFFHDFAFLRGANPDIGRELRQQFQRVVDDDDDEKPTGFFARARANKLPPLSIIDPHFGIVRGEDANDDHPNVGGRPGLHDIRKGQALIASIIAALAENPDQWNRTLLIITYDESGGFFDHVVPPMTVDVRKDFRQLGFRVPSLVVGPYVRRGCNIKTQLEHVSVIRTIEAIFGRRKLGDRFVFENRFEDPEVNARIDATNDVLSCLDADALEGEPLPPPRLDPVKFSLRSWRDLPRQSFHPELRDASRSMPEEIRAQAEEPVLERVMEIAEELGAIEVVP